MLPLLGDTIGANLRPDPGPGGCRPRGDGRLRDGATVSPTAELVAEIDACALGLDGLGVRKGDRVGLWAPNCAEWVFVHTPRHGWARSWSTSTRLPTDELAYVLQQAGISVLVSAPGFRAVTTAP